MATAQATEQLPYRSLALGRHCIRLLHIQPGERLDKRCEQPSVPETEGSIDATDRATRKDAQQHHYNAGSAALQLTTHPTR